MTLNIRKKWWWLSVALVFSINCGSDKATSEESIPDSGSGTILEAGVDTGNNTQNGTGGGGASNPDAASVSTPDANVVANPGTECAPIALATDYMNNYHDITDDCGGTQGPSVESRIPNPHNCYAHTLTLDQPLRVGDNFAISLGSPSGVSTPGTIEIWGASGTCGPVTELLWWAEYEGRILCAELTPTTEHTHLAIVVRQQDVLRGSFGNAPRSLQVCPGGTCPGGVDGVALAPGVELDPPPGIYEVSGRNTYDYYNYSVPPDGYMLLLEDMSNTGSGDVDPLSAGVFRFSPYDRFGDAWYCFVEESSITEIDNRGYNLSLRGVSRVPGCVDSTDSVDNMTVTLSEERTAVTSARESLSGSDLGATFACGNSICNVHLRDVDRSIHLYLTSEQNLGSRDAPTRVTSPITEAYVFVVSSNNTHLESICTTSGTVYYDPDGETEIALDLSSEFSVCPAEPLADGSLDLILE